MSLEEWAVQSDDEEWATGVWFIPELQAEYDMEMADARRAEEMEARRKADDERRMREWQARRDEEARLEALADGGEPRGGERGRGKNQEPENAPETKGEGTPSAEEELRPRPLQGREEHLGRRQAEQDKGVETEERVTVHFVDDGFTSLGRVWYQGMELTLTRGSEGWERTRDREGDSWLDMTEDEQLRRYRKVRFRPGPWPGDPWQADQRTSFQKDYSSRDSWEDPREDRKRRSRS